jgi:hypothetical protein
MMMSDDHRLPDIEVVPYTVVSPATVLRLLLELVPTSQREAFLRMLPALERSYQTPAHLAGFYAGVQHARETAAASLSAPKTATGGSPIN